MRLAISAVLVATLVLSSGCAALQALLRGPEPDAMDGFAARSECWFDEDNDPLNRPAEDEAHFVRALACGEMLVDRGGRRHYSHAAAYPIRRAHGAFDDAEFDHMVAAFMIVSLHNGQVQRSMRREVDVTKYIAMVHWYTTRIDPNHLRQQLAAVQVTDTVKQAFFARVASGIREIQQLAQALPEPVRQFAIAIPVGVYLRRAEHRASLASFYGEYYGALRPQIRQALSRREATRALLAETTELRDRYVSACVTGERTFSWCMGQAVGRPLTRDIVMIALALGDAALARAEIHLLNETPDLLVASVAVSRALDKAGAPLARRYGEYRQQERAGADRDFLASRFGTDAPFRPEDNYHRFASEEPNLEEVARNQLVGAHRFQDIVRQVVRQGRAARILFVRQRREHTEGVGCYETNRVDRIDEYGRLHYQERCRSERRVVNTEERDPVSVPATEARGLRRGDIVAGFQTGDRRGHISTVTRNRARIRLRYFAAPAEQNASRARNRRRR